MIVVLDSIRSAHNVGSIFRTADAFACERLFLCGLTPGPVDRFGRPNTKVTKVSLGAEKTVPWERAASVRKVLMRLRRENYLLVAVEQDNRAKKPQEISKKIMKKDVALVMGPEVTGLKKSVLDQADYILEIPMRGEKESFNVSVAFGIAAYIISQRNSVG